MTARNFTAFSVGFAFTVLTAVAFATPPYDVTATFDPAPGAASYNLYVDDCAATGATGAPAVTDYTSGVEQTALLTVNGTFQICVRTVDSQGTELADPGPVASVTVGPLGTVTNLQIVVGCPNGPCTVTVITN